MVIFWLFIFMVEDEYLVKTVVSFICEPTIEKSQFWTVCWKFWAEIHYTAVGAGLFKMDCLLGVLCWQISELISKHFLQNSFANDHK